MEMDKNGIILYTDGGCSANNQKDYSKRDMIWVVTDEFGYMISEKYQKNGGSNNIAELFGIRDAFKYAVENNFEKLYIRTDSRLAKQWSERTKIGKKVNDRELLEKTKKEIEYLKTKIINIISWVGREENLAGKYIEKIHNL